MRDLNDYFFFVQVVDHKGFAAAARELGMPRSRLSRRVGLLEDRLGVRLVQRTTRSFAVTEIGAEFYRHCVAMLVEAEAAEDAIERVRAKPHGIVRVSCASSVLHFQIADMIARFMTACPDVEVHLESTNRRVDVVREGFDVAIRVRFPPIAESDLVMKVLAKSNQRIVASPKLVAGLSLPLLPNDLPHLPSLAWGPAHKNHEWHLEGPNGAIAQIPHKPRLITEDMMTLRRAALLGAGIVQLPIIVAGPDLADGSLVNLLSGWAPKTGIIHAVFPSRRGLLPSVRALLDFLAKEYSALEEAPS